ncbi:MAG: DNA repair protein RecO [Micavibrio aeruginosavorus]|uniref:DNA repair protein RecO n=1 Tax=Micavibrio aeruginosavorus TaxID=349221 RepID=A0A7T5R0E4_9BACT|nr:MAG: DNA repair protein RecO [Micavibrio aeruginosavorus]
MEIWKDQGIVLSVRPHGENGAVVALLTEQHGRHIGYVRGAHSARMRGLLQPGNLVSAEWGSRVAESMGTFELELHTALAVAVMDDSLRLGALLSACALCDASLPERESHCGLFYGMLALLQTLETENWGPSYVMWELAFLRELGFGIDVSKCAAGGDSKTLTHISPKSGRAVSAKAAEPYLDKLLTLPHFLRPQRSGGDDADVLTGLRMTAYFLEHWAFVHHTQGLPESRVRFQERFARLCSPVEAVPA